MGSSKVAFVLACAVVLAGSLIGASGAATARTVPRPHIVWKPIPFGPKRRTEMAAYAKRHYGIDSWRLTNPRKRPVASTTGNHGQR